VTDADPSEWHSELGKALRRARKARGLSQERLGLETGIHRNYVGGIERGERKPTLERIVMLANELGTSLVELFREASEAIAAQRAQRAPSITR
jgi:transcriptional regulator with XRE-family HTH domain